MSSVIIAGNTSGTITLDAPNVAGTTVLTLPTANGTVLTTANTFSAGTGPAFSAYLNTSPVITAATFTKISCNTEEFDTNSNYDNSTNYRFTPTVAGYYMITACVGFTGTITRGLTLIYKNGSGFKSGNDANAAVYRSTASALIYMNGTTDYIELFAYALGSGTLNLNGTLADTYFQASMVRSA
jgi:hypothetical protein